MAVRKVYFNSICPVCNAGVTHQREKMASAAPGCDIQWIDINTDRDALAERGVTIDDVRLKLYVEDDEHELHVGAAAVAALWRETRGQRFLAWFVSLPIVSILARWSYDAFAALLFAWNRRQGRW